MHRLANPRVVIIDDKLSEALPIIRALSSRGIPFAFFDNEIDNFPADNARLKGVRLAIVDVLLTETRSIEPLISALNRVIDPDNGPYSLLAWTKHPDDIQELKRLIFQDKSIARPVIIKMIDKNKYNVSVNRPLESALENLPVFDFNTFLTELDQQLETMSPLLLLQDWEEEVYKSSSSVIKVLSDLSVQENSNKAENIDAWIQTWKENCLLLLGMLVMAEHGTKVSQDHWLKSLYLALNPFLTDKLEYLQAQFDMLPDVVRKEIIDIAIKRNDPHKLSKELRSNRKQQSAKLNTQVMLAFDNLPGLVSGGIYKIAYRSVRKRFFSDQFGKDLACYPYDMEVCDKEKQRIYLENINYIKQNGQFIIMEISASCDHAQRKIRNARFILGIVIPDEELSRVKDAELIKKVGPFYLNRRPIKPGVYWICLTAQYQTSCAITDFNNKIPYARIRSEARTAIQTWLAGQAFRQGMLTF